MANQTQRPDTALHNTSHLMQYHDLIESIVAAMDARDAYTAKHSDRVADMVLVLATALDLSEDETTLLHMAAHLHDIGKNLVRIMLETGGFDVYDLGRDVALNTFVDYVRDNDVDILCMSSLMTTTMPGMGKVIEKLKKAGLRDKVKIMVGGAPVSPAFAEKIGADGYTRNAIEAVEFAKKLVGAA